MNKINFYEMKDSNLFLKKVSKFMSFSFLAFCLLVLFVPWQQSSSGQGEIVALNPDERLQNIQSPISGRVSKWFVFEGSYVNDGDPIVEIIDNDPQYMQRLEAERTAVIKKFEASRISSQTALLDLQRQEDLWKEGLSSRRDYEKAQIEYKKLIATEASAAADVAKVDVKVSRQQTQLIKAPRKGRILKIVSGTDSIQVKEGDTLALFVPDSMMLVAEVFIDGNDIPLIRSNQKVRLQFEGWPAVQFSGWPSVAVGTFGGIVKLVDPSTLTKGKFRVLIAPDPSEPPWPDRMYLRQGTRNHAWILLNEVTVGFELWRKLNGFPATVDHVNVEINPDFKKNKYSEKNVKDEEIK